jgi:hypothetical protein
MATPEEQGVTISFGRTRFTNELVIGVNATLEFAVVKPNFKVLFIVFF